MTHFRFQPLVIVGGGGHALVVVDAALRVGFQVVGTLDSNPRAPLVERLSIPRFGDLEDLSLIGDRWWIVGVGDVALRNRIIQRAAEVGLRPATTVIHPSATTSPVMKMEPGVFVGPGAIVNSCALLGEHAVINSGAIIEHDCRIGMNAHIAPGAVLGGNVTIGRDTLVGLGACVLPGVSIGAGCTIGAGAVVVRDIGAHCKAAGVPARPISSDSVRRT